MESVSRALCAAGFSRTSSNSLPWVVLAVPGAGKTSLIRKIIAEEAGVEAYTFGVPDLPNTKGRYIKKAVSGEGKATGKIVLLDEFHKGNFKEFGAQVLFGDLAQFLAEVQIEVPPVSFYCNRSWRVPSKVCELLVSLGFEIFSNVSGSLETGGLFSAEPEGQILTYCPEVAALLRSHGADYLEVSETPGLEFDTVTLCLQSSVLKREELNWFLVGCTRVKRKLLILSPDAAYPTCG